MKHLAAAAITDDLLKIMQSDNISIIMFYILSYSKTVFLPHRIRPGINIIFFTTRKCEKIIIS